MFKKMLNFFVKKKEPIVNCSIEPSESQTEHYAFKPLPIDTSKYKFEPPSQKQLDYAEKLGIEIHPNMTKSDLSAVITKVEDNDMNTPDIGLLQYAQENGESPSPYLGLNNAVAVATRRMKDDELCSFYLYCLYCSQLGKPIDNFNSSPLKDKFRAFGNQLSQDPKTVDSIRNRPSGDFVKPNKRTIAYTTAIEYLKRI